MFSDPVLDSRLNAERVEAILPSYVDLMSVSTPRKSVKPDKFKVISKPSLVIQDMLQNQSGVHNIGGVRVLPRVTAG